MRPNLSGALEMTDFARCLLIAKGNVGVAAQVGENMLRVSNSLDMILKQAVDAGTTADPNWAGSLISYRAMNSAFLGSLTNISVFDSIAPDSRAVPMSTRIGAFSATVSGSVPGEGLPAALSQFALAGSILKPKVATAIVIVTEELSRSLQPTAQRTLSNELRKATAEATNRAFLAYLADLADDSNAHSSSGSTALQISADLALLAKDVISSGNCRPYFIMSATNASGLAFKPDTTGEPAFAEMSPLGGMVAGIQVLVSDALPHATDVLLVDADALALDTGIITLDSSGQADLLMSEDIDSTDAQMTSMFQTNSVALRAVRWFGYELWRHDGVSILTGCNW